MGKASLRNLLAHKGRLALSLLAVVLSAGFVAGTLIFTDTLQSSFDDLFAGTSSDVVVSPAETDAPGSNGQDGSTVAPATVPAATLETVRGTDGIAAATGDVFVDGATIIGSDGDPLAGGGPTFGTNWEPDERLTALTMVEGVRARRSRARWPSTRRRPRTATSVWATRRPSSRPPGSKP